MPNMKNTICSLLSLFLLPLPISKVTATQTINEAILFKPEKVFDGQSMHTDWVVLVQNQQIMMAGTMPATLPLTQKLSN